jgi:hypothetical protein
MRDGIARALVWVLRLMLPSRGRHTALPHEPHVTPTSSSPWSRPWTGPSAAEVRAIFGAEEALRLTPVQRERRFAVEFAALGVEYPYRYPGDQFTTREASQ